MAGISDLIGSDGFIEQMMLWGVANQVVSALASPAFLALQQDVQSAHPLVTADPATLATAVVRDMVTQAAAAAEAAKTGTDATRFDLLVQLAKVRIQPADLATAVLRSYMTAEQAQAAATPQGVDAADMAILTDLQGDAPGPQQLAEALRRGIIEHDGSGAASTSFLQGVAESRLHNKWAPMIDALSAAILSPPDLAEAVIRNFITEADGAATAAKSGVSAADFATMTHLAGDAPGPQQLAEALRRGAITAAGTGVDSTSFDQGIAEGRLADKWAPVIEALSKLWPTPDDALDATLKGQVTADQGKALYVQLGGDTQFFDWLLASQGNSPSPLELIEMANRGYIPWGGTGADTVSYEQGFKEGRWRDKWSPVYEKFAAYFPAPSEVVALLAQGSISSEVASSYLARTGMESDTISAFLETAHLQALSEYRGLSVGVALDAYKALLITGDQLQAILLSLHVLPDAVALLTEYADFQRVLAQTNNAVTRIRNLYVNRKINLATARDSLTQLDIPAVDVPDMIAIWESEFSVNVKTLTGEQIALGYLYGAFTQAVAQQEMVNIGYTPLDGYALLCAYSKSTLPNPPSGGPPPAIGQITPGTT
jgi:hypothetical protein